MKDQTKGKIVQIVRMKSELSEEEILKISMEREPQYKALLGLLQKYYVKFKSTGEYGGIYIWDSVQSMNKFRESELAASIPKKYKAIGSPAIEIVDILFQLKK
ncbi:MAG: hypothetical protein JW731_16105 [Bacteroidales bacterium]|nr:hypothetical protein [Bacteroidales bacterium]